MDKMWVTQRHHPIHNNNKEVAFKINKTREQGIMNKII